MRKNLIRIRKERGYTQIQVAKELDISDRHYKALEAGTSKGSVDIWEKMKELFGYSIDYLLEQEGDTEEKPDGNQCRVGSSERPTR